MAGDGLDSLRSNLRESSVAIRLATAIPATNATGCVPARRPVPDRRRRERGPRCPRIADRASSSRHLWAPEFVAGSTQRVQPEVGLIRTLTENPGCIHMEWEFPVAGKPVPLCGWAAVPLRWPQINRTKHCRWSRVTPGNPVECVRGPSTGQVYRTACAFV